METFFWGKKGNQKNQFKSYYVVWKHTCGEKTPKISILFKSYYVVWKLANLGRIIPIVVGLNRTM